MNTTNVQYVFYSYGVDQQAFSMQIFLATIIPLALIVGFFIICCGCCACCLCKGSKLSSDNEAKMSSKSFNKIMNDDKTLLEKLSKKDPETPTIWNKKSVVTPLKQVIIDDDVVSKDSENIGLSKKPKKRDVVQESVISSEIMHQYDITVLNVC